MRVGPVKTYYGGALTNYLRQCNTGGELMAEYLRRLEAIGVKSEAPFFDEIVCESAEQSESVDRLFRELCEERGLEIMEG